MVRDSVTWKPCALSVLEQCCADHGADHAARQLLAAVARLRRWVVVVLVALTPKHASDSPTEKTQGGGP